MFLEELPASSNGLGEPEKAEILYNVGRKKIRLWWIGKDINGAVVPISSHHLHGRIWHQKQQAIAYSRHKAVGLQVEPVSPKQ